MSFCTYSKEACAAGNTEVDNNFIYEYMPDATGNAVKVYIYGLFLCRNDVYDMDLGSFAAALKLSPEEVRDAFTYWEEFGLVRIVSQDPFEVKYQPRGTSSVPRRVKPEKYALFTASLQALIPTRMISTGEFSEYFAIMETYGIKQEAMLMIVKYCVDLKGNSIGYKYISAVARDFGTRKILTAEQVENELSSYVMRTSEIEKILKAMSLKKKPEIEDLNYLNKWTRELGFEPDNIIYAAGKIKKGGMKKLDEFISELYSVKKFSREEIENYSKTKTDLFDLAIKINRRLSVYYEVLDTVVENYTSKWCNFGFDEETLLLIAAYCFKKGKNTLEDMDATVAALAKNGAITLESVTEYFAELSKDDKFIGEILAALGLSRKATAWDRQNLKQWQSWNFSDEMILEAAKLSAGKVNPIPYMNAILGRWKRKEIFSKEQIDARSFTGKHFENERTYTREELDKIIDDIADIEF